MRITVYTKTGCPWCEELVAYLDERGLVYEEKNVTRTKEYYEEMVAVSGQDKAPTVDIDGHVFGDWGKDEFEAYVAEHYPLF